MRFGHVNLVARDWRALARFYCEVLGCSVVPPERDLHGPWLDRLTGIPGARIRGVHLRLPGHAENGPTLEIFTYDSTAGGGLSRPDAPGFGHIAFQVADVSRTRDAVLERGGQPVGDVVRTRVPEVGTLTCAYVRDPEGNIVELQRWDTGPDTTAGG